MKGYRLICFLLSMNTPKIQKMQTSEKIISNKWG